MKAMANKRDNLLYKLRKKGRTGQHPRTRYLLRRGWRAVQTNTDKAALP